MADFQSAEQAGRVNTSPPRDADRGLADFRQMQARVNTVQAAIRVW